MRLEFPLQASSGAGSRGPANFEQINGFCAGGGLQQPKIKPASLAESARPPWCWRYVIGVLPDSERFEIEKEIKGLVETMKALQSDRSGFFPTR